MSAIEIRCYIAPTGEAGPLVLRTEPEVGIVSLQIGLPRPCPRGINFDDILMFDMQSDGGVDAIEMLYRPKRAIRSLTVLPSEKDRYWRLFLSDSHDNVLSSKMPVDIVEGNGEIQFLTGIGEPDSRYLIGPSARALVSKNRLAGLSVEVDYLV